MNVMPVSRFIVVAIGISLMAGLAASIAGSGSTLAGLGAFVLVMIVLQIAYSVHVYLTSRTADKERVRHTKRHGARDGQFHKGSAWRRRR